VTAVVLPSERVRIARTALGAALAVPAVVGGDPGPNGLEVTTTAAERLPGVRVTAGSKGWQVHLSLIARAVPLPSLGNEVMQRVLTAVAALDVEMDVSDVEVRFTDVVEPA
jgi:hypothetical protein